MVMMHRLSNSFRPRRGKWTAYWAERAGGRAVRHDAGVAWAAGQTGGARTESRVVVALLITKVVVGAFGLGSRDDCSKIHSIHFSSAVEVAKALPVRYSPPSARPPVRPQASPRARKPVSRLLFSAHILACPSCPSVLPTNHQFVSRRLSGFPI